MAAPSAIRDRIHIKAMGGVNNDGRTDIAFQNDDGTVAVWEMNGTSFIGGGAVGNPGTGWGVLDDNMRFIYSTAANETLAATSPAPDEFVFASFAAGSHDQRFQPNAGHDRVQQGAVRVLRGCAGGNHGDGRRRDGQPGQRQFVASAGRQSYFAARSDFALA